MPGGRPPKPTALKLLTGTARAGRLNPQEPTVPAGPIKPPSWLRGSGRRAWRMVAPTLEQMRILTVADIHALALLCDVYGEVLDCRAAVREHGRVYTTTTPAGDTMVRPRPEVAMLAEARRQLVALLTQFGSTPSARAKVQSLGSDVRDPFEDFLGGLRTS